jgi:exportin-5
MRDSRSCCIVARVIDSILKHFAGNEPGADNVREFISTEVLKACITSVHDPYFVDLQKDLAQVIASIWLLYNNKTPTPRAILFSLPGITAEKVERTWAKLGRSTSRRQKSAIILDLLEGLRGVSISEQGKIDRRDPRKVRSEMQQRYMRVEGQPKAESLNTDDGPDLGGVAEMFS